MKKSEIRIIESFQKKEKKFQKKNFFSAILQKFSQLGNYSRWKINKIYSANIRCCTL
jgi:hypothetical protein